MASSGGRRIILRVTAAIAVVMLSMAATYIPLTQGVGPTVQPPAAQEDEQSRVFIVTPEPPEKVPGVIRIQTGLRRGALECNSKYMATPLEFNTHQRISNVSVYTTFDSSGVRIYVIGTLPGDALIVNGHLAARALQVHKLLLPNSSRFYPEGWKSRFGPADKIILCQPDMQA